MGHRRLTVVDLIGILGLIGYRQAKHPRRLDRRSRFFGSTFGQAYFVEAIIFGEAPAGLLIRGADYELADAGVVAFPVDRMDRRPNRAR